MPVMSMKVKLYSDQAQRVYERSLDRLMRSLYATSVIMRILGAAEAARAASTEIERRLTEADNEIELKIQQTSELQRNLEIQTEGTISYTLPKEVTVQISSPLAGRFLQIVRKMDTALLGVETMWFAGAFSDEQRFQEIGRITKVVYGVAQEIVRLEQRARAAARRTGKDEQVAETVGTEDAQATDALAGLAEETAALPAEEGEGGAIAERPNLAVVADAPAPLDGGGASCPAEAVEDAAADEDKTSEPDALAAITVGSRARPMKVVA